MMNNTTEKIKKFLTPMNIATLAILLALEIVLSRFLSINTWNMKIGFAFIPLVLAAYIYGAPGAMIIGGLGDLIGALAFPIGPYFPGFTLTAILNGLCFGLLLYRHYTMPRLVIATLISQFICGMLINSYWIYLVYHSPYWEMMPVRAGQAAILSAFEILVMYFLLSFMQRSPQLLKTLGLK